MNNSAAFIVHTQTDPETLHAVASKSIPTWFKVIYILLGVFAWAYSFLFGSTSFLSWFFFLVGLALVAVPFFLPKLVIHRQIKRLREAYGTDVVPSELSFYDDHYHLINEISGGELDLSYAYLKKIQLVQKLFLVLTTRENQATILKVADIPKDERKEFYSFLKKQCPQAKHIGF